MHPAKVIFPMPEVMMALDTNPHAAVARKWRLDKVRAEKPLIAGRPPRFAHPMTQDRHLMLPVSCYQAFGG
jgi:hypothetical protein